MSLNKSLLAVMATVACLFSLEGMGGTDKLELSGFARAVGGKLDTNLATYEGYDSGVSFSEKSLIAVQADYGFSSTLSASVQFLLHTDQDRKSGVEWLYLTYAPVEDWQFNVGRLRTPFLKYSDVIDVGFAYPWINAPQQLYSSYIFSQYEGANSRYRATYGDAVVDFEVYYGRYKDDIISNGVDVEVKLDELYGGVVELNYGGFQLRTAIISGPKVETTIDEVEPLIQGLRAAGFDDIAERFDINDSANAVLLGASYDTLSWYVSGEWMKISSDIDVLANLESFYVSYGYYYESVLFHLTYASSNQSVNIVDNTIPVGVTPELDLLYYSVEALNAFLPTDDLDTWTLGARWDVKTNLALKGEISFLDGKEGKTSFFDVEEQSFDRNATLYQVALEWVF